MKIKIAFILIVFSGLVFSFFGCQSVKKGKRIFYENSYHQGYGSSDDVMAGIKNTLAKQNVRLEIFFLDAKRKSSKKEIEQSARQ